MGGCGHASIMKPGRRWRPTEKRQIQMEQANGLSKTSKFRLFVILVQYGDNMILWLGTV